MYKDENFSESNSYNNKNTYNNTDNKSSRTSNNYSNHDSHNRSERSHHSSSDNRNSDYNSKYSQRKSYDSSNYSRSSESTFKSDKINFDQHNAWIMRHTVNPSFYEKVLKEDEYLIQDHLEKQKKKQILDLANFKNIDIDISFNQEKILERSSLNYFYDIENLNLQLKKNLDTLNFKIMTPIQKEVIKFISDGKDVMGCSQTGSGKTVAFLLPIISRILLEPPLDLKNTPPSPRLLIMIPTRELAEQIYTEARKLVNNTGLLVNKIYGGVPHDEQLTKIYSGCDILVATPGRLLDFAKNNNLSLKHVKYLIIDEADRLLDMGFQPQLMKIAFETDLMVKEQRQNLLFSATFTEDIKNISKNFMNEHYFIQTIFDKNPSKNIKQELVYAVEAEKSEKLHQILKNTDGSIIIFVETKFGVDNLYMSLKKYGHRVACIHGDKKQFHRQEAINRFSMGQLPILIATDIASRGLDFPRVTHVINFDLPTNIEDYIHRIGRTGRCGNTGTAISFINEYNKPIIKNLYFFLKKSHQKISEWFEELFKNCKDITVNIFDRIPKRPKKIFPGSNPHFSNNFNNTYSNYNANSSSNNSFAMPGYTDNNSNNSYEKKDYKSSRTYDNTNNNLFVGKKHNYKPSSYDNSDNTDNADKTRYRKTRFDEYIPNDDKNNSNKFYNNPVSSENLINNNQIVNTNYNSMQIPNTFNNFPNDPMLNYNNQTIPNNLLAGQPSNLVPGQTNNNLLGNQPNNFGTPCINPNPAIIPNNNYTNNQNNPGFVYPNMGSMMGYYPQTFNYEGNTGNNPNPNPMNNYSYYNYMNFSGYPYNNYQAPGYESFPSQVYDNNFNNNYGVQYTDKDKVQNVNSTEFNNDEIDKKSENIKEGEIEDINKTEKV